MLLIQLTQNMLGERLRISHELQCTILEVKTVEGLGTTIDVILVNGTLNQGDTIVVCGMEGPIVTTVRALLTPPPMTEIRVKVSLFSVVLFTYIYLYLYLSILLLPIYIFFVSP
jgi:translation initiation factor 5B